MCRLLTETELHDIMSKTLLDAVEKITSLHTSLPFSLYSSIKEQVLFNVPVNKPVLIVVLTGEKRVGSTEQAVINSNEFVFLSNNPAIDMRNIPKNNNYRALLIEFESSDFDLLPIAVTDNNEHRYFTGYVTSLLNKCLYQLIELADCDAQSIISLRRKELLLLLYQSGFKKISQMRYKHNVQQKIYQLLNKYPFENIRVDAIASALAMSESTLRRKLSQEGSSIQIIKAQIKHGLALHLLQTTSFSISLIAGQCGYQSLSHFNRQFKARFKMTPSALRKTKMIE